MVELQRCLNMQAAGMEEAILKLWPLRRTSEHDQKVTGFCQVDSRIRCCVQADSMADSDDDNLATEPKITPYLPAQSPPSPPVPQVHGGFRVFEVHAGPARDVGRGLAAQQLPAQTTSSPPTAQYPDFKAFEVRLGFRRHLFVLVCSRPVKLLQLPAQWPAQPKDSI
jgi:hypothetical protein